MTFKSSLKFAGSLIFPKAEKKSSARRSLFGAMLCIGLSIVPLIAVISITDGMIDGMTDRLIGLSSGHLQSYIASGIPQVKSAKAFKEYAGALMEIDGVSSVYPEINTAALAAGKNVRKGIQIRAVEKDIFQKNQSFKKFFEIKEGSLEDFSYSVKTAVIGQKLSEELGIHPGDSFRIITTKNSGADKKIITPKLSTFTVSAVVSSGYQELDQFWVFIPMETAYSSLSLENASYNVLIETKDAFSPDLVRIQLECKEYFGRFANVYRWDQIHSSEFENFSSTKVMLVFVMMLIVLVASVNISSSIIMLVMERQKEIAILKSIGATSKGISLSFLMAGTACGAGGLLFGVPLGLLITVFSNQLIAACEKTVNFVVHLFNGQKDYLYLMDPAYYLSEIPVKINPLEIVFLITGVILLSVLVSYFPAKKAGKEKPLEILRKG